MALLDPRWDALPSKDWDGFAKAWIAEISGVEPPALPELPQIFPDDPITSASEFVVPMNFTASAESQWRFIEVVFRHGNDETMGHLAAGPVEHLLSKHGDEYIERIETLAQSDPGFASMLSTCRKHLMSEAVWQRLCRARNKPES
ncbi:MAG: DUF6869 domain-containing protein [Planctomycetota bacterium]